MAAESVAPPSTDPRVPVSTFWNVLFSCWLARISRHCTSGKPASIITENWRVKMASSLELTPAPKVGKLNSLPFSDIFVGVICWRRSSVLELRLACGGQLSADGSAGTIGSSISKDRHVLSSSILPIQRPTADGPENSSTACSPPAFSRLPPDGRRYAPVDHVLQLIRIRRTRKSQVQSDELRRNRRWPGPG